MPVISFTKVNLPYGWLGNMAPYPIVYQNERWRTSEALFQALRFEDPAIKQLIQVQASPMAAKMMAKGENENMIVVPCSPQDVENMRLCLELKFSQHPAIRQQLILTGDHVLVEDIGKRRGARHLFWGAHRQGDEWIGTNTMGILLMELREKLNS